MIIVGNKRDLKDKRAVSFEEASEFARQHRFKYYECSAKSGDSVEEVFTALAKVMKQRIIDIAEKEGVEEPKPIRLGGEEKEQRCCSSG